MASLGIAVIMLLMGLSGPVLGVLLARYPIRRVMSAGAVLMAAVSRSRPARRAFPCSCSASA